MKKEPSYSSDGYFHLRTPKYSALNLDSILQGSNQLKLNLDEPFLESVLIASESLYNAASKTKKTEKELLSLLKYSIRASSRCTPFGGFAGVSVGTFGESNDISLRKKDDFNICLDNQLFFNLVKEEALDQKKHWPRLIWYPNSSWYTLNEQIRFYEYYQHSGKAREHKLSSVQNDDLIREVLLLCKGGETFDQIFDYLLTKGYSKEESTDFVCELIENQLLFSELEMTSHGDYQMKAIGILRQKLGFNRQNSRLVGAFELLEKLKNSDEQSRINTIKQASDLIASNVVNNEKAFKVDMVRRTNSCKLSCQIASSVIESIEVLKDFQSEIAPTDLALFFDSFLARYEDREVFLVEAIDSEMGIGYPARSHSQADITPLLRGLRLNDANNEIDELKKLILTSNQLEVFKLLLNDPEQRVLDLEKVIRVKTDSEISNSVSALCSVICSGQVHVKVIIGSSAGNLMSRFSFTDPELLKHLEDSSLKDQGFNPNAIVAEIDHVPQTRVNNILNRDKTTEFTIPILIPGFNEPKCIYLRDITIKIKNGRFVLASRELGKNILPRLTNAHNYHFNSLPIYKFLCDLQFDHLHSNLEWNWGVLSSCPNLPRVKYKETVLKRERWLFQMDIEKIKGMQLELFLESFKTFAERHNLPNRFNLCDGDNELTLSSENKWCQLVLHEEFAKKGKLVLEEDLFYGNELIVKDVEESGYYNEVVIPLRKNEEFRSLFADLKTPLFKFHEHSKPIGSEWLYFKVYSGLLTADEILVKEIKPLVDLLYAEKLIDNFFFIRYADPHWHLRVRFKLVDSEHVGKVTSLFYERIKGYCEQKTVWKIQADQYDRELIRYGAENIDNSERIFSLDSVFALEILEVSTSEKHRWHTCMLSADQFISSFGLSLEQKVAFTKMNSLNFQGEFRANHSAARKLMNEKYRLHKSEIENLFKGSTVDKYLSERSFDLRGCALNIDKYVEKEVLSVSKDSLLSSYIHMSINRIIRSKPRVYEMLIYDFLHTHYTSKLKSKKVMTESLNVSKST